MGTDYYFYRNDNQTKYFMGKMYALARYLQHQGPIVVMSNDTRNLAETIELACLEDGDSESQVAPTGRDCAGTSIHFMTIALDIMQWSDGMPISLVSEDNPGQG